MADKAASGNSQAIAVVYDPSTAGLTATGPMKTAPAIHAAALLASGEVLLMGGLVEHGVRASGTPRHVEAPVKEGVTGQRVVS